VYCEEGVHDPGKELRGSRLPKERGPKEGGSRQRGDRTIDIQIRRQVPTCDPCGDNLPERVETTAHHCAVWTPCLTAQAGAIEGHSHHPGAATLSHLLPDDREQRDQVITGIARWLETGLSFLERQRVPQEILTVRPMPVDRRPGNAGFLAYP
jgi:hypothetical protein